MLVNIYKVYKNNKIYSPYTNTLIIEIFLKKRQWQDLNLRIQRIIDFKSIALDHSATLSYTITMPNTLDQPTYHYTYNYPYYTYTYTRVPIPFSILYPLYIIPYFFFLSLFFPLFRLFCVIPSPLFYTSSFLPYPCRLNCYTLPLYQ